MFPYVAWGCNYQVKIVSSVPAIDSFPHLAAFSNTSEAGESTCFPVLSFSACRVGIFTAERLSEVGACPCSLPPLDSPEQRRSTVLPLPLPCSVTGFAVSFLSSVWAHPWSSGLSARVSGLRQGLSRGSLLSQGCRGWTVDYFCRCYRAPGRRSLCFFWGSSPGFC